MNLRRFFRPTGSSPVVELFTKDGCHLCDEALAVLERVRRDHPFELRITTLREGDAQFSEYRERFPVITINGAFAFQYRVPEKLLRKKLAAVQASSLQGPGQS